MERNLKESASRKLTQLQVEEIRQHAAKGITQGSMARHYGVSIGQIGRIVRGESWSISAQSAGPSPAQKDATLARLLATQRLKDESPELLAMAKEFQALLDEPRGEEKQREFVYPPRLNIDSVAELGAASIEIPLSPLDGGNIPDAVEGAVEVLQNKARAQGADIDKLIK